VKSHAADDGTHGSSLRPSQVPQTATRRAIGAAVSVSRRGRQVSEPSSQSALARAGREREPRPDVCDRAEAGGEAGPIATLRVLTSAFFDSIGAAQESAAQVGAIRAVERLSGGARGADASEIMVQLDWDPEGMLETLGAALGSDDRRVKSDLERFKEMIENRRSATGAWRGEVDRGGVVR
jgi:hypothetical protein